MRVMLGQYVGYLLALIPLCVQATPVHEYVLDNGLKLMVKEDHRAPVVVSQVWYKVGASYEHDGITGISHALEHMMFKGTETHPAGEFSRIIAANGGRENAFTSADYTAYFQELERSRLSVSFELESDRMRHLTLRAEEFAKEIQVVMEERRLRTEDEPTALTHERAMSVAFQTSPYRHPTIGWMADINALTVDDLRAWYGTWYAPNNATVVVVGDVKPDEVRGLAEQYFGPLPQGKPVPAVLRPEVKQDGIKRLTVEVPAKLPYLIMAYKVPVLKMASDQPEAVADWEPYALEELAGILDGGNSARFSRRLIRDKQIAAAINLNYNLYSRLENVLVIAGTPAEGHTVEELEQALRDEIADLQRAPVEAEELERVRAQVVAGNVYDRDSVFFQAMQIGTLESVGLGWRVMDEYVDRIMAVTALQVQAVARKYLTDEGLTVAVLQPQPIGSGTSAASSAPAMGVGHAR